MVDGRAAYVLLDGSRPHVEWTTPASEFQGTGPGTARTVKVLRTLAEKWC